MYNKLYIANVLPSKWVINIYLSQNHKIWSEYIPVSNYATFFSDCNGVSLPVIGEVNNTKKELCPRCTCTYESRNTTTMKVTTNFCQTYEVKY